MILLHTVLLVTTVVCIEGFLRSPFLSAVRQLGSLSAKAVWVLRARHVSDERKQLSLVAYSGQMMVKCLIILGILLLLIAFVVLVDWLAALLGVNLLDYLLTWAGILLSVLISIAYVWIRNRWLV